MSEKHSASVAYHVYPTRSSDVHVPFELGFMFVQRLRGGGGGGGGGGGEKLDTGSQGTKRQVPGERYEPLGIPLGADGNPDPKIMEREADAKWTEFERKLRGTARLEESAVDIMNEATRPQTHINFMVAKSFALDPLPHVSNSQDIASSDDMFNDKWDTKRKIPLDDTALRAGAANSDNDPKTDIEMTAAEAAAPMEATREAVAAETPSRTPEGGTPSPPPPPPPPPDNNGVGGGGGGGGEGKRTAVGGNGGGIRDEGQGDDDGTPPGGTPPPPAPLSSPPLPSRSGIEDEMKGWMARGQSVEAL
eukprot:jgi/Bigna1/132382/aug1.17_g7090